MPNWCSNNFVLRLADAAEVKTLTEAADGSGTWNLDHHPILSLLIHRGWTKEDALSLSFRWDEQGNIATNISPDGTCTASGWMTSAWHPPEDLINTLHENGMLIEWVYDECGNCLLGKYTDEDGVLTHEEGDYESIEDYERILDEPHPGAEGEWECTADAGDLVVTEDYVHGLCTKKGTIMPFGSDGGMKWGEVIDGKWRFLDDDAEQVFVGSRMRQEDDGLEVNMKSRWSHQ